MKKKTVVVTGASSGIGCACGIGARNKHIAPKERRVERLPSGYSVREFYSHPQGCYWYAITPLEVVTAARKKRPIAPGA